MRFQDLREGRHFVHFRGWWWQWTFEVCSRPALGLEFARRPGGGLLTIGTPIGSLYLSRGHDEWGRKYGVHVAWEGWWDGPTVFWSWGQPELESSSEDPWWQRAALHPWRWLLGPERFDQEQESLGEVLVPMPEGCYVAKAERSVYTFRRPRWPWPMVRRSVWLSIQPGIPFEGKGENSWDCGDDGLYGIGGDTLSDAIGRAVATALKNRDNYGRTAKERAMGVARIVSEEDLSGG